MGQRMLRVNELVRREVSEILHTRYKGESVYITVTGINVAPDLRRATVYYSVFGDDDRIRESRKFLKRESADIRRLLGKRVVLKYLPHLQFAYDDSIERGTHLNALIDQLDLKEDDLEENAL